MSNNTSNRQEAPFIETMPRIRNPMQNNYAQQQPLRQQHQNNHVTDRFRERHRRAARQENKTDFSELAEIILKKKQRGCKEYHFRPIRIDGVYCYIVLYLKNKVLTVESINVKCKFKPNTANMIINAPYVLYHTKYRNIPAVLELIDRIVTTYKIVNGDLLSPTNYNDVKAEELLIPYSESEHCCVCLDNTTDTTPCGHYICFSCRDKCILQDKSDCPMCRSSGALNVYTNPMRMINNRDYAELYDIFVLKIGRNTYSDDEDVVEDDDDEPEEADENNTGEELGEVNNDIRPRNIATDIQNVIIIPLLQVESEPVIVANTTANNNMNDESNPMDYDDETEDERDDQDSIS